MKMDPSAPEFVPTRYQSPMAPAPAMNTPSTPRNTRPATVYSRHASPRPFSPTPRSRHLHVPHMCSSPTRQRGISPLEIADWRTPRYENGQASPSQGSPRRTPRPHKPYLTPLSPTPRTPSRQYAMSSPGSMRDLEQVALTHLSCGALQAASVNAIRALMAAVDNARAQLSQPLMSPRLEQDIAIACGNSKDVPSGQHGVVEEVGWGWEGIEAVSESGSDGGVWLARDKARAVLEDVRNELGRVGVGNERIAKELWDVLTRVRVGLGAVGIDRV